MAKKYNAEMAMERIEIKKAFPEMLAPNQHATYKGVKLYQMTEAERLALPLHACDMTGKLDGVAGLSTCPTVNPSCLLAIRDPESPCHECFAVKTMAQYNAVREWLENNAAKLAAGPLTPAEIDDIIKELRKLSPLGLVRLEPFGDAINQQYCENMHAIVIAGAAVGLYFAMWTKLPHIWDITFKVYGKPENMTCIYSAPVLGQTCCPMPAVYEWLDAVFVVTKDIEKTRSELIANGEHVHMCRCEAGSCSNSEICGVCYRRAIRKDNTGFITWIIEGLR